MTLKLTANFETLKRACVNGDLALMECQVKATGKVVEVVCAMYEEEDGMVSAIPIAQMYDENPYDILNPPNPEGGFDEN